MCRVSFQNQPRAAKSPGQRIEGGQGKVDETRQHDAVGDPPQTEKPLLLANLLEREGGGGPPKMPEFGDRER